MADTLQIAVFDGETLSYLRKGRGGGEAILALGLDWLLVRTVKIPAESLGDADAFVEPLMKELSPFPDEPLTVSCETVAEDESGRTVIAAALPEGACGQIEEALDAEKLDIVRVDALAFGALRSLWSEIFSTGKDMRRIVLIGDGSGMALFILERDKYVEIRHIHSGSDIKREITLSILRAADLAGPSDIGEIVVSGGIDTEPLEMFGSVRVLETAPDTAAGIEERAADPGSLNALPASWLDVLEETRFKRKLKIFLSAAFGIWTLLMAAMFLAPQYYLRKKNAYEAQSKAQKTAYRSVSERKRQVEAVRSVSNHDLGALETLRVVNSAMQPDMTLSKWTFKRGDKVSFSGTVDNGDQTQVYTFKNALTAVTLSQISENEEDDKPFFTEVALPRGVISRGSKAMFDVECSFKEPGEED